MSALEQCEINNTALLDEYRSLRTEILQRQQIRILVLGFTMTAVGVILGLIFGSGAQLAEKGEYFFAFLINFLLILINGALILTIENTQQIHLISRYIIKFIEPEFGTKESGMGWETRWTAYWTKKHDDQKYPLPGYPWADQRGLTLFYIILTIAVFSVIFMKPLNFLIFIPIVFFCAALKLCHDLYFRKTKGWENPWPKQVLL